MSESDLEDEAIPYKALFLKALSSSRSHSQGIGTQPLVSSILAPNTFWTSVEKHRFFYGITHYSRLRPDLIAAHVGGGKTAVDVMAYVTSLEEGSKSGGADRQYKPPPGARCVSREWVTYEEKQAVVLTLKEVEWEESQRTVERELALKQARDVLRKKKEKGFIRDIASRDRERERREQWTRQAKEYELEWGQEDTMNSLGYHELSYLDSLIRSHEETRVVKEEMSPFRETLAEALSVVDPSPQGISESSLANPSSSPERGDSPVDMSAMTAAERRRLQKRLHMRKKRAEATGTEINTEAGRLRPGRKTKRPQPLDVVARGADSSPATRSPSRARTSQDEDFEKRVGGVTDKGSEDEQTETKKYKKRGLGIAQRIQKRFTELGLDFSILQERGLDIFNLAKFWSLSELFAGDSDAEAQFISSETLQLMRACLDEFLHGLIHHTIALAEEERTMKEHSKVWRGQLNDIKPHHVTDALHLMGKQHLQTKNTLLQRRQLELEGNTHPHHEPPPPPLPLPAWSQSHASPQHNELYEPLLYHPSLILEPDLIEIQDVLIASDDEDLADAKAKAESMVELAREVKIEERDERLDRRHEAFLWRCAGVDGEGDVGQEKGRKVSRVERAAEQDESMDAESSEDQSMGDGDEDDEKDGDRSITDEDDNDMEVEQILRMGLSQGAARGIHHLRLTAASGDVKSQPFILNSSSDEKGMLTDSD